MTAITSLGVVFIGDTIMVFIPAMAGYYLLGKEEPYHVWGQYVAFFAAVSLFMPIGIGIVASLFPALRTMSSMAAFMLEQQVPFALVGSVSFFAGLALGKFLRRY